MAVENILDLSGISSTSFTLGPIASGVRIKNSTGNLVVRNNADGADAELTASKVNISGNILVLNSDAAGSGADWLYTIQRPSSGMTAAVTITLPPDDGTAGQVLQTDGSGVTTWTTVATAATVTVDTTTINFGDTSPIAMFTLPANAVVDEVDVIIDTAFNDVAAQLSIGISGTPAKFMSAGANYLAGTALSVYTATACRGVATSGSTQAVIATLSPGSASAGSVRVQVKYYIPQ